MRLRRNEFCPIHRSRYCYGRKTICYERRATIIKIGVQRIEDPHHPRGYRELRSPAEMRKLLKRKVTEQNGVCAICRCEFTDYGDVVPDHIESERNGRGFWEMITPITSKQFLGGVTQKKDRPELRADASSHREESLQ